MSQRFVATHPSPSPCSWPPYTLTHMCKATTERGGEAQTWQADFSRGHHCSPQGVEAACTEAPWPRGLVKEKTWQGGCKRLQEGLTAALPCHNTHDCCAAAAASIREPDDTLPAQGWGQLPRWWWWWWWWWWQWLWWRRRCCCCYNCSRMRLSTANSATTANGYTGLLVLPSLQQQYYQQPTARLSSPCMPARSRVVLTRVPVPGAVKGSEPCEPCVAT